MYPAPPDAKTILIAAADHQDERAAAYDAPAGERSIAKTVAMFNALTGHQLAEKDGWFFMVCLKSARAYQGREKADNYEDGTSYFALAGECALKAPYVAALGRKAA